jgi:hypothetical protein
MNANVFELNNENVRITYSSQGNAGQPFLTYQDPDMDKTFPAAEIWSLVTEIGELVTVTLFMGILPRHKNADPPGADGDRRSRGSAHRGKDKSHCDAFPQDGRIETYPAQSRPIG